MAMATKKGYQRNRNDYHFQHVIIYFWYQPDLFGASQIFAFLCMSLNLFWGQPRFSAFLCHRGAAIGIFFLGFCLGGVTEYSGERAVRRFVKVRQYRRCVGVWRNNLRCLRGWCQKRSFFQDSNGGFHSRGGSPSSLDGLGQSQSKMDDNKGYPHDYGTPLKSISIPFWKSHGYQRFFRYEAIDQIG